MRREETVTCLCLFRQKNPSDIFLARVSRVLSDVTQAVGAGGFAPPEVGLLGDAVVPAVGMREDLPTPSSGGTAVRDVRKTKSPRHVSGPRWCP